MRSSSTNLHSKSHEQFICFMLGRVTKIFSSGTHVAGLQWAQHCLCSSLRHSWYDSNLFCYCCFLETYYCTCPLNRSSLCLSKLAGGAVDRDSPPVHCGMCSSSKSHECFLCCLWVAGLDAVEFVANHAEITIAFVQESKLPSVCKGRSCA